MKREHPRRVRPNEGMPSKRKRVDLTHRKAKVPIGVEVGDSVEQQEEPDTCHLAATELPNELEQRKGRFVAQDRLRLYAQWC